MTKEYESQIANLKKEIKAIKYYSDCEHKVKDMIVGRHKEYSEMLKRELVIAKNIIK